MYYLNLATIPFKMGMYTDFFIFFGILLVIVYPDFLSWTDTQLALEYVYYSKTFVLLKEWIFTESLLIHSKDLSIIYFELWFDAGMLLEFFRYFKDFIVLPTQHYKNSHNNWTQLARIENWLSILDSILLYLFIHVQKYIYNVTSTFVCKKHEFSMFSCIMWSHFTLNRCKLISFQFAQSYRENDFRRFVYFLTVYEGVMICGQNNSYWRRMWDWQAEFKF